MTEKARVTAITLYDADRAIIGRMQDRYGMNFSAAIRAILADWDRIDRARMVDTSTEYATEEAS